MSSEVTTTNYLRVQNFREYENEENNNVLPAGTGIPLSIRTGSAA
jgi:hypothetical protein